MPTERSDPPDASDVWARTRLHLWPERYRLVSLPVAMLAAAAELTAAAGGTFASLLVEGQEVSLVVTDDVWRYARLRWQATADDGPFRVITLDVKDGIDLAVIGYLAPALAVHVRLVD